MPYCISISLSGTKTEIIQLIPAFIERFNVIRVSPFYPTDNPDVFYSYVDISLG